MKIFDTKTGTLEQDLRKNAIEIESIAWSPNGEYIFVNLWCESTVEIWNVERKKCVKCLDSHKEDILAAAWSPNGKYIVTTSMDGTVKINDIKTGLCIQTLIGYHEIANSVAWSPDGNHIVSIFNDGALKIWGVE